MLGTSESCIATHPSAMCVALVMLDTVARHRKRTAIPTVFRSTSFIWSPAKRPTARPYWSTVKLLGIEIEPSRLSRHSHYLR